MWNKKYNKVINVKKKRKQSRLTDIENKLVVPVGRGKGDSGRGLEN